MAQSLNKILPGGLINLSLNAVGLIGNKKNVAIYKGTEEVLTGDLIENGLNKNIDSQYFTDITGEGTAILSAKIEEAVSVMQHPLETGAKVADHIVQQPRKCSFTLVMPFYAAEPVIKELLDYKETGAFLTVKVKGQILTNMVITGVTRPLTAKEFSRALFDVSLQEAIIIENSESGFSPAAAADADTVNNGLKEGREI